MDWMKRASFILRLELYLEFAKTSGLAVLENNLFSVVTYFMKIKIVAFIKHMCVVHHETVGNIHKRKLKNLDLHIGSNITNTSAICNMTNLALTKQEIELFSKGLDFGIFPNYLIQNFYKYSSSSIPYNKGSVKGEMDQVMLMG